MAKEGLTIPELFRFIRKGEQWALCIGAGTSKPLLPDWYGLIGDLIKKLELPNITIEDFVKDGFSLDAIIQAIKEMSNIDDKDFLELLSDIIYSPIKNQLNKEEQVAFNTAHDWTIGHASTNTKNRSERWELFCQFRERVFGKTTAFNLAKIIAEGFEKGITPSTILTFNGEACFLALLNSFLFENKNKALPDYFDRVINSISDNKNERIPCYHCHGIIPNKDVRYKNGYKADEKLVFSEDSYLQLANNNFSWQSSSFINTCLHNKVIFVGVSLTDSNMRRWLSWIHYTKLREKEMNEMPDKDSTEHYWIKVKPSNFDYQIWYENLVSLLGVRIIWIDNWTEVATAIGIILGITSPQKHKGNSKTKKYNTKKNISLHTKRSTKKTSKNMK